MNTALAAPEAVGSDDPVGQLRLLSRLTAAFLLDTVAIVRGDDGHLIDTLLISAATQANIADVIRQPELQAAFADAVPPDELRRPVSINALATSLSLPFETVRRRIAGLAKTGHCVIVEGGVIVPGAVLSAPRYYADAFRGYERLRAFYYQLRDQGLLGSLPPAETDLSQGPFPIRAVSRIAGAYVLRVVELLASFGSVADSMITMEVFRSNTERLPHSARGGPGYAEMVGDEHRAPISVGALARRVGMPPETVRRHVGRLEGYGVIVRVDGGLIVPTRFLTRPLLRRKLVANAGNLQRMFASLARLGVLEVWDGLPVIAPESPGRAA